MKRRPFKVIIKIGSWLHHHLLGCLLVMYGVALAFPGPGTAARDISFGIGLSLPSLMLAILLFNAGLGIRANDLRSAHTKIKLLIYGLTANTLLPIVFLFLFSALSVFWPQPEELQMLMVGIAIIGSMPIAGSSTAWAQTSDGNLALSLGLVVVSTVFSPILTPFSFHLATLATQGKINGELLGMAKSGVMTFLMVSVVIPSILGIFTRTLIGEKRIEKVLPILKLIGVIDLLFLNYSNAAIALPQAFVHPRFSFLLLLMASTLVLCISAFLTGGWIARKQKTNLSDEASLMYGLGMNNNGSGLVLASTQLQAHPMVMLPIIFYNLEQQIVAGLVGAWLDRKAKREILADVLVLRDFSPALKRVSNHSVSAKSVEETS